jgi:hypothetical protein
MVHYGLARGQKAVFGVEIIYDNIWKIDCHEHVRLTRTKHSEEDSILPNLVQSLPRTYNNLKTPGHEASNVTGHTIIIAAVN